jgi:hypothetical protein
MSGIIYKQNWFSKNYKSQMIITTGVLLTEIKAIKLWQGYSCYYPIVGLMWWMNP